MEAVAVFVASPVTRQQQYLRAFAGLFMRDLFVLRRELLPFVIRVCMNPLLFLFVFTVIMPHMGAGNAAMNPTAAVAGANFSTVLLPGLMAVAIMFSGIAAVALPLAQEFGVTREIDDRVMCPLPVAAVAIEKIVFSALQSPFCSPSWFFRVWSRARSACLSAPASSRSRSVSSSVWSSCPSLFWAASTIRGPR